MAGLDLDTVIERLTGYREAHGNVTELIAEFAVADKQFRVSDVGLEHDGKPFVLFELEPVGP